MSGEYDDIINLPHHVSTRHPHMSNPDRAAQFSPFAALTGYEAAVKETARRTDARRELDESEKEALNDRLLQLAARLPERPEISVTYFVADAKKAGGMYVTATGCVKKLKAQEHALLMEDGREIAIEDVLAIQGEMFGG